MAVLGTPNASTVRANSVAHAVAAVRRPIGILIPSARSLTAAGERAILVGEKSASQVEQAILSWKLLVLIAGRVLRQHHDGGANDRHGVTA